MYNKKEIIKLTRKDLLQEKKDISIFDMFIEDFKFDIINKENIKKVKLVYFEDENGNGVRIFKDKKCYFCGVLNKKDFKQIGFIEPRKYKALKTVTSLVDIGVGGAVETIVNNKKYTQVDWDDCGKHLIRDEIGSLISTQKLINKGVIEELL